MPITNSFRNRFIEDPEECYLSDAASGFSTFESFKFSDSEEDSMKVMPFSKRKKYKLLKVKNWFKYFQRH